MIFIDSNVPMYLIGAPHPHAESARRLVERAVTDEEPLVTNVEVFQELLHRYTAIRRSEFIAPAFDTLTGLIDAVFAIDMDDVLRAREILSATPVLSARDAMHVATMERHGVDQIISFDRGFDAIEGIRRLGA